jgi:hypothetical protein
MRKTFMPITEKRPFILLVIFSMIFSACSNLSPRADSDSNADNVANRQSENTGNETSSADKKNEDRGLCANKYYPVETVKGREYKISSSTPARYVLTQNKREEDSFTENRKFDSGTEMTTNWSCTEEGLRNVEYNSSADFSNGNFKMETLESSGITLPKTWEVGRKWTTTYKINAKLNAGPASGGAAGTVKIDNEIASLDDKVTTPAGDFEAAKVVSTININLNIGKPMNIRMINWYAPDVGLIKQEVKSPFGPQQNVEYTGEKGSE